MRFSFIAASLLTTTLAFGATTKVWNVSSHKEFDEGQASGATISSLGEVRPGFATTRVELGEAYAYSSARAADGSVWIGTGDHATVYHYKNGKAQNVAKLDGVLVSALALGDNGTVYAAVVPGGKIYSIDGGKVQELVKVQAEHVWALRYDKGSLLAATGVPGKLVRVELASKKQSVIFDSGDKHILAFARGDDGDTYVGTSDQAIVYKVSKNGQARALQDFDGEEVRAIVFDKGVLYVAVNEFTKAGALPAMPWAASKGTKLAVPSASATTMPPLPTTLPARDRKGRGGVYRIDADGRTEQLYAANDAYFTALDVDARGHVFAANGASGKVYDIAPDHQVSTVIDVPERQVLTLALTDHNGNLGNDGIIGTGDAGALYRVSDASAAKNAKYESKVFDAQYFARWGQLRYFVDGSVALETRSGNTAKPDKGWSSWQKLERVSHSASSLTGAIVSPAARYVQARFLFSPKSGLRHFSLYYQPQNQRQRVTELTAGEDRKTPASARAPRPHVATIKLKWKTENPDEDELVYRLTFREEGEPNARPLGGPEPLTKTEYDWNTDPIADGTYLVTVAASDERSNGKDAAFKSELTSDPIVVDNRKPDVVDLKVSYPQLSGRAKDDLTPIADLAYSIDGGEWQPLPAKDGLFDQLEESFSVTLPKDLASGTHGVSVRALDSADNVGAAQATFRVK